MVGADISHIAEMVQKRSKHFVVDVVIAGNFLSVLPVFNIRIPE
jgi:hypothetical protein